MVRYTAAGTACLAISGAEIVFNSKYTHHGRTMAGDYRSVICATYNRAGREHRHGATGRGLAKGARQAAPAVVIRASHRIEWLHP